MRERINAWAFRLVELLQNNRWVVHMLDLIVACSLALPRDHSIAYMQEEEPSYKELQQLLKDTPSSNSSKPLAERLQAEFKFNRDSIQ